MPNSIKSLIRKTITPNNQSNTVLQEAKNIKSLKQDFHMPKDGRDMSAITSGVVPKDVDGSSKVEELNNIRKKQQEENLFISLIR